MWADHRVARGLSNRGGHGQARVLGSAVERSESDPSEGVDPPDVGVDVDERMANDNNNTFFSFISGAVFCTGVGECCALREDETQSQRAWNWIGRRESLDCWLCPGGASPGVIFAWTRRITSG